MKMIDPRDYTRNDADDRELSDASDEYDHDVRQDYDERFYLYD
jgi:hypothetical protein